jgi:hypothetical protein
MGKKNLRIRKDQTRRVRYWKTGKDQTERGLEDWKGSLEEAWKTGKDQTGRGGVRIKLAKNRKRGGKETDRKWM